MKNKLILASSSPRRVELLSQLGVQFTQQAADIDESQQSDETAEQLVCRLAMEKARHVFDQQDAEVCVLGSDTIVVVDQHILGKPNDFADAKRMLSLLSARQHRVMTAVSLICPHSAETVVNISEVTMTTLDEQLIAAYWQTNEPLGKAGAYAIQGIAGQFIEKIEGSFSAIMGLPLFETRQLLVQAGFDVIGRPVNEIAS